MSISKNYGTMSNSIMRSTSARLDAKAYRDRLNRVRKGKSATFSSQKLDIKDYIISPEGWEGIMFTFYFASIPYITGITFLFLFIAKGDVGNFLVFDIFAFFIVWAIGYEIVASFLLLIIFMSYFNFMNKSKF